MKQRKQWRLLEVMAMPAWVGVMLWLFQQTHYRDQLLAHVSGKPGVIGALSYSPQLLHQGDNYAVALFVWLWVPPLVCAAAIARILVRRRASEGGRK
ncbi:MAG: hypothetical protein ACJ8EQ_04450 [Sphingomicrobium sp.]